MTRYLGLYIFMWQKLPENKNDTLIVKMIKVEISSFYSFTLYKVLKQGFQQVTFAIFVCILLYSPKAYAL